MSPQISLKMNDLSVTICVLSISMNGVPVLSSIRPSPKLCGLAGGEVTVPLLSDLNGPLR